MTKQDLIERNPHRTAEEITQLLDLTPVMVARIATLRSDDLFQQWTDETDETCAIYIVADDLARERDLAERSIEDRYSDWTGKAH